MKAVIFDFNGTLFWDTSYHKEAFDIFLAQYGKAMTMEEMAKKIFGRSNKKIMNDIFETELTADKIAALSLEKELIYQELCRGKVSFAPGAESYFEYLKSKNIPFTIGTAVGRENIDFYYEEMDMAKWFDRERIVYNDGSYRGKPAPDIFLAAAKKIGIPPDECLIFEDSKAGIEAAEACGSKEIVIVNSANGDYSQYPYRVITNFTEMIERE